MKYRISLTAKTVFLPKNPALPFTIKLSQNKLNDKDCNVIMNKQLKLDRVSLKFKIQFEGSGKVEFYW